MASALIARVVRTVRRDCLVGADAGDRVVIALSGGSDSVALTWLLHALAPDTGLELAGLVHVNHQLRGAESDADEAFCRALAARLGLPIAVTGVDVAALARARRASIEAVAREVRYAAFDNAITGLNGTLIATGHTMDDQAETVLLRALRGAGTRGLSGIRARRGRIIRPLLGCRRRDLRAYLDARGETWRDDESNTDRAIARNRIRLDLVPVIEAIAPSGVRALARLAALAQDDERVLMETATKHRAALVLSQEGRQPIEIDSGALSLLPPAIARRLVRSLVADVAPGVHWSAGHLEAVCGLAATDKSVGHLDLPGIRVDRRGDVLTIAAAARPGSRPIDLAWPVRVLAVPGSVELPEAGAAIVARRVEAGSGGLAHALRVDGDRLIAALQARSVPLPLAVRNRRPGDRLRPLGAPGRRKLQDVLVDRKVPRSQRDRVPVVVDRDGRIVWVAGIAVADDCRVTAPEDSVLILELREQQTL